MDGGPGGRGGSPTRARTRVLDAVASSPEAPTVDEVAARVGIGPATARKHLDELARDGSVHVQVEHSGRPGRPRLRYRAATSTPGEPYQRLSLLLLRLLEAGEPPEVVGREDGRTRRQPGEAPVPALLRTLAEAGFDPVLDGEPTAPVVTFRRCPYASAAIADRRTICGLHLGFVNGVLGHLDGDAIPFAALDIHDPLVGGCRLPLPAGT